MASRKKNQKPENKSGKKTDKEPQILEGEILSNKRLARHFKDAEENAQTNGDKVKTKFWKTLAKANKQLPAVEQVVAAYYCAFDPKTHTRTRAILLAALGYFVLPLDSIPDFLFGFGFTDDIAVLTLAFSAIKGSIKKSHINAARRKLGKS